MLTQASPLELPDEAYTDLQTLQLTLRHWILRNLDHWVNGKGRSVAPVMHTLMQTWALDRMQAVQSRLPDRRVKNGMVTLRYTDPGVGEGLAPSRLVDLNNNFDIWVGAGPVPARGEQGHHATYAMPEELTTKSTKDTKEETRHDLRALGVLRGESPNAPSGRVHPPAVESISPPFVGNDPAAGSRLHRKQYVGAQAHGTLPYEPSPAQRRGVVALERELTLPAYDPDYDVAAGLPKYITGKKCEAGCLKGFGNYEAEAVTKYYWRNKVRLGGNWEMFGLPCKVFEEYDAKGRSYLVAMADVYTPRQESEQWAHYGPMDWTEIAAELAGVPNHDMPDGVGEGLAPSRYGDAISMARVSHNGARASCPPSTANETDAFEQREEELTTKNTKDTKQETLRDLRALCGQSSSLDTSTTAGGRKALPYASSDSSACSIHSGTDAAASEEPNLPWRRGGVALETPSSDLRALRDLRGDSSDAPGGMVPPSLESDSPAFIGNEPAAGSRLHSQEYVSAQAHELDWDGPIEGQLIDLGIPPWELRELESNRAAMPLEPITWGLEPSSRPPPSWDPVLLDAL